MYNVHKQPQLYHPNNSDTCKNLIDRSRKPAKGQIICQRIDYLSFSVYGQIETLKIPVIMIFVVVALLFYVHGKHLRSCRDGQLT